MLILPIKKKWFKMIRSGEKKEEYREIKPYWKTRFDNMMNADFKITDKGVTFLITFRNGYQLESPTLICSRDFRSIGGYKMNNKTNIEEDIKIVNDYLDNQDRKFVSDYRLKILQAIENILADRERLEKENEELLELEISVSAHNKIEELERDKFKLKTELENNRMEQRHKN